MKPKVEFQVGIDDLVKMCIISPYKREMGGNQENIVPEQGD